MAALVLGALALLWPAQLGGRLSMLVTVGTSMEPRISEGDLVFVARGAPYRIGEVVAYRSGALRQVALHRIVDKTDSRYILKGDNNSWIDSYRPADAEVIGRLWVHLPGAGRWLDWLRRPRETALLTGLIGILVSTGIHQARKRMQRRRRMGQTPKRGGGLTLPDWRRYTAQGPVRGVWARVALGGLGILLLGGVSGAAAWSQPLQRERSDLVPFDHRATFRYETAAAGPLMDEPVPGDKSPVYFNLSNRMAVHIGYRLDAPDPSGITGTYRLVALLGDGRGWRRTMLLRPTAAFQGETFDASGTLSLPGLQALIGRFEAATGLTAQTYELRLRADVTVRGTVDGLPMQEEFSPELAFDVDEFAIRPQARQEGDPFQVSQGGAVSRTVLAPNRLRALGIGVSIATLRAASTILCLLGALTLGIALTARRSAPVESPAQRIALRYGSRIVDVERVEPRPDERIVRMTDIRDLVRIAENLEAPILHAREGGLHRYLVQEGPTTYIYELADTERSERPALLASPSWAAPLDHPHAATGRSSQTPAPRLPAPAVEIDLSAPLPPARPPATMPGPGTLPPAPPRRRP